jgi:hypothetical protein
MPKLRVTTFNIDRPQSKRSVIRKPTEKKNQIDLIVFLRGSVKERGLQVLCAHETTDRGICTCKSRKQRANECVSFCDRTHMNDEHPATAKKMPPAVFTDDSQKETMLDRQIQRSSWNWQFVAQFL